MQQVTLKKLAIITTHPIQYYAPVFKLLHQRQQVDIKVYYTWGKDAANNFDPGFSKNIAWDIDLLSGYEFEWVTNSSRKPGSHRFNGIINPHIIQRIDRFGADAILVIGWAYQSHLKVMRHYDGKIPVYFRGDSTMLDKKSGFKNVLKSLFLKWVYQKVNYALYTGANNRAYFKNYGLKDEQLIYAPHAIDNGRFAISRGDEAAALRKTLNVLATDILILFAGKFISKKDPLILIEAVKVIADSNLHLLLVGDGALKQQMTIDAKNHPNIHFLDFQNQSAMPVVYQACDIFCLPSQGPGETWGLAINEAMACGKAIVASDKCGSAIDLVKPGVNGYIFKSEYLHDLIDSLELLCDKEKLTKYGDASKEIIKDFSFLHIAKPIENLINETQRPYQA